MYAYVLYFSVLIHASVIVLSRLSVYTILHMCAQACVSFFIHIIHLPEMLPGEDRVLVICQ